MTIITPGSKHKITAERGAKRKAPFRVAIITAHACPYRLTGTLNAGGLNVYLKEMTRNMNNPDIQIDVFTFAHPMSLPAVHNISNNARIIHLPITPYITDKNEVYEHLPQFSELLLDFTRDIKYDIVYSHYWLSTITGAQLAGDTIPHIVAFHTLGGIKKRYCVTQAEHPRRAEVEKNAALNATSIITSSQHEHDALVEMYGVNPRAIKIIPPGVDTHRFNPRIRAEARRELGLKDEKIVTYIGRLDTIKEIPTLVSAFTEVSENHNCKLYIVGAGETAQDSVNLEKLLRAHLPPHKFNIIGAVKHDQIPTYHLASDIFAITSRYESFGIAALEAIAAGTPVVAFNTGGISSIVRDGENGYLIERRNRTEFARRLNQLLADDKLRSTMGFNGHHYAQNFSWQRVTATLQQHFYALTATPQTNQLSTPGSLEIPNSRIAF